MLKQEWEHDRRCPESTVSYLQKMFDNLTTSRELVRQHETNAKSQMKRWYDRNAHSRAFTEGDLVLVLMPTSTCLLAKWQGPFPIMSKLSDTTYQVRMGAHTIVERTFHVNMLALWHSPSAVCMAGLQHPADDMDEMLLWPKYLEETAAHINLEQTDSQTRQLEELLARHTTLFSETPGKTTQTATQIDPGDTTPVHLTPSLPNAQSKTGSSQGRGAAAAPGGTDLPIQECTVVARCHGTKEDGTFRFCVDYHRLNRVTKKEPLPHASHRGIGRQPGRCTLPLHTRSYEGVLASTSRAILHPIDSLQHRHRQV